MPFLKSLGIFTRNLSTTFPQPQNFPGKSTEKVGLSRFPLIIEGWGFVLEIADWWKRFTVFIFKARWFQLREVERWGIPGLSEYQNTFFYLWGGTKLAGLRWIETSHSEPAEEKTTNFVKCWRLSLQEIERDATASLWIRSQFVPVGRIRKPKGVSSLAD